MREDFSRLHSAGWDQETDEIIPGLTDDKSDISWIPIPSVPNPRLEKHKWSPLR